MPELLVHKGITAASFAPDAVGGPLPAHARTVIVGAGVIGSSVAYHLAAAGEPDVLVVERASVAAGTTWHAAGLLARARASHALTELTKYSVDCYSRLQAETGVDLDVNLCGSLTLARNQHRWDELRYAAMVCRHMGVDAELVGPERVPELWPLAVAGGLVGALWQPGDGMLNPGMAALALAKGAHQRGVTIREGVRVSGIETDRGRATAVVTDRGTVTCERVVLACGLWTRDLAAACGASVPLWPAEHVHVRTAPLPGAVPSLPVMRELDGSFYIRHLYGALLVGAFEPDGKAVDASALPAGFAFGELPPDWDHFAPVQRRAEERVPSLRGVAYERFLNAPESFTPDANFCLGETAEVDGLFVAAGFNSQGILFGPGAGKALAEWMIEGAPTFDAAAVDVRRFSRHQSNRRYLAERMEEALGRLYALHFPHWQPATARGVRRTPLHDRLAAAGAVFGEMNGLERANWYAPASVDPTYAYNFRRQNWFPHAAEEHRAAREAVTLFDLSAFAKFEVAGPDALAVLQRAVTADLDVKVGRAVYTLALNARGGIELDGTVTRLAEDRFFVVTPSFSHHKTLWMLRKACRGHAAAVSDVTTGLATLAVMGPLSRELLSRISPDDLSNAALPWMRGTEIEVGRGFARCLRVSFVGELGYELYPDASLAVDLYDQILAAGSDLGLRHAGFHALDSLRSEKGYRHLGHDIGPAENPYQAGLGFTVALDKPGGFLGRDAIACLAGEPLGRRQVFVKLSDPDANLIHGESIYTGGEIVGRMTSGAYGHTLGAAVGLAFLRDDVPTTEPFEVDCAGDCVPATLSETPFYDPANTRLRG